MSSEAEVRLVLDQQLGFLNLNSCLAEWKWVLNAFTWYLTSALHATLRKERKSLEASRHAEGSSKEPCD